MKLTKITNNQGVLTKTYEDNGKVTNGKQVKPFDEHPETEKVFQLIKQSYTEYGIPLPETTVREMLSLYLHQIIDDKEGCFCISTRPSGGKTQSLLHIAWYLHLRTELDLDVEENLRKVNDRPRSLSITFQQKKDIKKAYEWLRNKGVNVAQMHGDSKTKIEQLKDYQIILHTHFKLRDNKYTERYFTYKGRERDGFIFDEAYFGTLNQSLDLKEFILMLDGAILEEESKGLGLPLGWMKDVRKRCSTAHRLLGKPHVQSVPIQMPYLSERYIDTAWRLTDHEEKIQSLFIIANAEDNYFKASKEKGLSNSVLLFKVNDTRSFRKLITTDATREVRRIHELPFSYKPMVNGIPFTLLGP